MTGPGILFAATEPRWSDYEAPLRAALEAAGVTGYRLSPDLPAAEVDYIVYAPNSSVQDFSVFPQLKAVLNTMFPRFEWRE